MAAKEPQITVTTNDDVAITMGEFIVDTASTICRSTWADRITDRKVAERSILIKNLLEDLGADGSEPIPIPNVRIDWLA